MAQTLLRFNELFSVIGAIPRRLIEDRLSGYRSLPLPLITIERGRDIGCSEIFKTLPSSTVKGASQVDWDVIGPVRQAATPKVKLPFPAAKIVLPKFSIRIFSLCVESVLLVIKFIAKRTVHPTMNMHAGTHALRDQQFTIVQRKTITLHRLSNHS